MIDKRTKRNTRLRITFDLILGYLDRDLGLGLTTDTDMLTIVKVMATENSGLVVRDRMWLKITIPNAFIGELPSYLYLTI